MNLTFNTGVPAAANNPSNDQGPMKVNNVSNAAIWDIDHAGFNNNNGGYHTVIHMLPNAAPAATPTIGQLISNVGNDGYATDTSLFFQTGGAKLLQLTRNIQPLIAANGYTFIPGAPILQWGTSTSNVGSPNAAVIFPLVFNSVVFTLQILVVENSNSRRLWHANTVSTTGFTAYIQDTSGASVSNQFYWMAIGN